MHRLAIRIQITILAGLLGVILVSATAGLAMYLAQKREIAVAQDRLHALAVEMARALDLGMFERYRDIRGLADIDATRDFWITDPRDARSVLNALQRSMPEYAWIGFVRPDGVIQSATHAMSEGTNVSDRPWFMNGRAGPFIGDVHEGKRLTDPPGSDDRLYRFVNITVPVRDPGGGLVGVIGARLNWGWAADLKLRLAAPELGQQSIAVWILSKDGSELIGPSDGAEPLQWNRIAAMPRSAGGVLLDRLSGETMLNGYAVARGFRDYSGLGWIVVVRQPARIAFAIARDQTVKIATIGGAVAILGLLLFAIIGGRLARPIVVLTSHADQIGRDPGVTMLPRLTGSREVELLSGALRSLLRRIGDAERRTAESEKLRAIEDRRYTDDVDQLRRLADTDPLTGLLNRRSFDRNARDALEHFRRHGRRFAVLVIDIDHFKKVNDTYGHLAGDEVIQFIGNIIAGSVRAPDRVARVGGEEFFVLLHEVEAADALAFAERVRAEISSAGIARGSMVIKFTVSIGGSLVLRSDRDIEDAISRADAALYEAKAEGRNTTILKKGGSAKLGDMRAA